MKPTLSDSARGVACFLGAVLLASVYFAVCLAADITPGYTFTSGEKNITDTKLNNAARGTIATSFFTGKTSQTPVTADTLLFYADADLAYRKTTVGTLFGNAPAINGLSTINSVGDFSVATSKFTVASATGNTAVGGNLTVATNASITGTLGVIGATSLGALTSTNGQTLGGGQLLTGGTAITGALTVTSTVTVTGAQTNNGSMVLGDAAGDTLTLNGTLAGTVQGTPTVSLTAVSADASDSVLLADASDSGKLKMALLSTLIAKTNLTIGSIPNAGTGRTNTHSLGGIPQSVRCVLVCTNADLGYAVGEEVGIEGSSDSSGGEIAWNVITTSTNLTALRSSAGNVRVMNRTTGQPLAITETNWNLKAYLVYFP